jgi:endonuclease YncB( thermonuclease family)
MPWQRKPVYSRATGGRGGGKSDGAFFAWIVFGVLGVLIGVKVVAAAVDIAMAYVRPAHEGQRVLTVVDGDTAVVFRPGFGYENARLIGFDTPELRSRCLQEFWMAQTAKAHLHWLLWTSETVEVHGSRRDRYGRPLVALMLDGRKLAPLMISTGMARPYNGGIRQGWCS